MIGRSQFAHGEAPLQHPYHSYQFSPPQYAPPPGQASAAYPPPPGSYPPPPTSYPPPPTTYPTVSVFQATAPPPFPAHPPAQTSASAFASSPAPAAASSSPAPPTSAANGASSSAPVPAESVIQFPTPEALFSGTANPVSQMRAQWEKLYGHRPMAPPPPETYSGREPMIEATKAWAMDHGYKLVITHSTRYKGETCRVRLSCSLQGTFKSTRKIAPEDRKRKRESRKLDCPMKVYGSRKRFESEWVLHVAEERYAEHNHGPLKGLGGSDAEDADGIPTAPALPELEAALFAWQRERDERGAPVHGNGLKSKALELYKTMPAYAGIRDAPDFNHRWLYDYRTRHGLPIPSRQQQYRRARRPDDMMDDVQIVEEADATAHGSGGDGDDSLRTQLHEAARPGDGAAGSEPPNPKPVSTNNMFTSVKSYVKGYMSQFDASHDWQHIVRVVALARKLLAHELTAHPETRYDSNAVILAALLHDVGDAKYAAGGAADNQQQQAPPAAENQIAELLLGHGCSDLLALKVQTIVKHVSFSAESRNPRIVRAVLAQHPELAVVQDADRLDALGAVGVARAFAFGAAKRPKQGLPGVIGHFAEKLERLEAMMKTDAGRQMARERTQRLVTFRQWFNEETNPKH